MLYQVRKFANPTNENDLKVFHASPFWEREVGLRDISDEISHASSINIADVRAVIESFLYHMPAHLMNGDVIRLDDFGIFKLKFHAVGKEKEEDVRASDINHIAINFRPSPILMHKIGLVKFSRASPVVTGKSDPDEVPAEETPGTEAPQQENPSENG
ncbi:MAG: HU family DNA-binding protein [Treponema sp.]|nr:HU family DNA-binding protein [Treponema sp.]